MKLGNRRGAVLVLAAFVMVVVLSMLVVVVDFSRIYVQKNELQTAADAAALAGVMELSQGAPTQMVQDTAKAYGQSNKAMGQNIAIANADIRCGVWDDAASAYSGDSGFCNYGHNAVTVTTRANSTNSIPGILGGVFQIKATGRAYAAYIGATKCVKPWAIPYTVLTKLLQPNNPDTLRPLDTADARLLKALSQAERTFQLKIGAPPNMGNFGSLDLKSTDPSWPSNGAPLYQRNIAECNNTLVGPGDTIFTETGNKAGPTGKGIIQFCTTNGYYNTGTGDCTDNDPTESGIIAKSALWSPVGTMNGNSAVVVRQIVSWSVDNYDDKNIIVRGHFLPYLTLGSITPQPTTIQRPILIK